ncbi:MAG: O-methyltransferase [Eubacteriales bacterium]|nr:O-methyltransferase [Eubacteriales bacterium]
MSGASSDRRIPSADGQEAELHAGMHREEAGFAEPGTGLPRQETGIAEREHFAETIVDPQRMEIFIEAMTPPGPDYLRRLEEEAIADRVPIIRPQTRNLIRFFIKLKKPMRILEVGTAVGFSALFMQYYAPAGCRIVTIEKDPARAAAARENIARFGNCLEAAEPSQAAAGENIARFGNCLEAAEDSSRDAAGGENTARFGSAIEVLEGDAAEVLREIREDASFDMVFMDAAKGQYIRFLPEVLRLLRAGGILITDNILQEGDVLSSRFAVTRRNRTIHSRMREYVRALAEEPSLETLLLPTGDGAAVCLRQSGT